MLDLQGFLVMHSQRRNAKNINPTHQSTRKNIPLISLRHNLPPHLLTSININLKIRNKEKGKEKEKDRDRSKRLSYCPALRRCQAAVLLPFLINQQLKSLVQRTRLQLPQLPRITIALIILPSRCLAHRIKRSRQLNLLRSMVLF